MLLVARYMQRRRARRLQSRRPPYVHARKRATLQASIHHDHQRLSTRVGNPTIGNGTDQDHRHAPEPRSRIPPRLQSPPGQLRHLETSTPARGNAEILRQTGKHDRLPVLQQRLTQWPTRSAISIFECSNITLKALRSKLGIKSLATQLTAEHRSIQTT